MMLPFHRKVLRSAAAKVNKRPYCQSTSPALPQFLSVHERRKYTSSLFCHQYQYNKLQQQLRCHSSDSSKSSSTSTTSISSSKQHRKRRRRKSSSYHSSLSQIITNNHPKHTAIPPPYITNGTQLLTRKQLLRLTPKQRANLHKHRLQQYKDSRSYLDQARTNVRSNIKFLSEKADTNFTKNIQTIKRLFNGEEVWKDAEQQQQQQQHQKQQSTRGSTKPHKEEESLIEGIDWERAPHEIKSNLQSNLSKAQNWLHQQTDGIIPSSTYVNTSNNTLGDQGGSIATRVQKFHHMKTQQQQSSSNNEDKFVMDNVWIAKNVLAALSPGIMLHLYFLSLQDEMKEYYESQERLEREKIMGYEAEAGYTHNKLPHDSDEKEKSTNNGKMGISSAFITEGGNTWDRLKMVVNDLFLGGAEEKISKQIESQKEKEVKSDKDDDVKESPSEQSVAPTTNASVEVNPISNRSTTESAKHDDPTIHMLIERIQVLERQLGSTTSANPANLSDEELQKQDEEQRKKDHVLKRKVERLRQSPIRNRREDKLEVQWREEEEAKKRNKERQHDINGDAEKDDTNDMSYSLANVASFMQSMIEPTIESIRESTLQKTKDMMSNITDLTESKEEEKDGAEVSAIDNSSSDGVDFESTPSSTAGSSTDECAETDVAATEDCQSVNRVQGGGGVKRWAVKIWHKFRKPPPPPPSALSDQESV